MKQVKPKYKKLLADIGCTIETARKNAVKAINTELVKANWEIGRHIIEFEQKGKERAEYGTAMLTRLSRDLRQRYGKGLADAISLTCADFILLIKFGRQCLPN
jgi:DUF1016 N-terminal domain